MLYVVVFLLLIAYCRRLIAVRCWLLFDVCCASFTVVDAQSPCLMYVVRCALRFNCLCWLVFVWCCVGRFF